MRAKSTHKGHCQICGRQQAVEARAAHNLASGSYNTTLSKHGYTVKGFGYFAGTCHGSDHLPMEHDVMLTHSTIRGLHSHIIAMEKLAGQYKDGTLIPETCGTGKTERSVVNNRIKFIHVRVPFAEGEKAYQEQELRTRIWNCENEVRGAKDHIEFLETLMKAVHGKPLIAIPNIKPVEIVVGLTFTCPSGTWTVSENVHPQWVRCTNPLKQFPANFSRVSIRKWVRAAV